MEKHEYQVDLNWKKGRLGMVSSPELEDQIEVATPPQFPGGVEGIWSLEHLLTASVSSCFMTTFLAIAEYSKLAFLDLDVSARCKLGKSEGKMMVEQIELRPELVIADQKFKEKAMRIMEKAEQACLITRSIKAEIIFDPKVVIGALD